MLRNIKNNKEKLKENLKSPKGNLQSETGKEKLLQSNTN